MQADTNTVHDLAGFDDTPVTIPAVALRAAQVRGDHPAVVEATRSVSYAQLGALVMDCAAAFVAAGLDDGDRVAIWAHNGIDWIIACLGAQAAGGVVVPVNTRFKGEEAAHVLGRSRTRFLVHSALFLGTDYRALIEGQTLPALERLIALPTEEQASDDWDRFLAQGRADADARAEAERRVAALSPDHVSDIIYTSGTTGAPKGVVTAHGQNVAVYREWVRATTLNADDRYALIWPFFHCSGYKSGWLASLIAGSTLYPQATLATVDLVRLIAREKITLLPGPPTLFQGLLDTPESRDGSLASLRVTITGATMVAPSLIEQIRDELGMEAIFTGYGLTESCGTVTMTDADDGPEVVVVSPGKAISGVEIAIADEEGNFLEVGTEGEILVRGFNVMLGYFEDPAATAQAIRPDGWMLTGDYGKLDEKGYLIITGRKKDIYITGGFNCYPAEIEDMMMRHPAIAEVAMVGVPDRRMGEVGKAFIVFRAGQQVEPADIIAWCKQNMANYKVPRFVVPVDALPRTSTGKVQKFLLPQD